jgi:hypothetical protein
MGLKKSKRGVTDFTPDKLRGKAPNGGEVYLWVKSVFLSTSTGDATRYYRTTLSTDSVYLPYKYIFLAITIDSNVLDYIPISQISVYFTNKRTTLVAQ